jgi:preprotein translocase subunit YajC
LQAQAQGSGWTSIIMMVALIAIFYFFMIRPQQKRQKEIQKAREALTNGDKVMTAGGIYGKVKEVSEKYFIIEIAENTRIRVAKDSIYPAADETPTQA